MSVNYGIQLYTDEGIRYLSSWTRLEDSRRVIGHVGSKAGALRFSRAEAIDLMDEIVAMDQGRTFALVSPIQLLDQ